MVTIKFRAKDEKNNWCYGMPIHTNNICFMVDNLSTHVIDDNTIGQFSNIFDKHNTEIYNGDIIKYYSLESDGIENYNAKYVIHEHIAVVEYKNGCFSCLENKINKPLFQLGLFNLKEIQSKMPEYYGPICQINHINDIDKTEKKYYDCNGFLIDERIIGIEIINNIYNK